MNKNVVADNHGRTSVLLRHFSYIINPGETSFLALESVHLVSDAALSEMGSIMDLPEVITGSTTLRMIQNYDEPQSG